MAKEHMRKEKPKKMKKVEKHMDEKEDRKLFKKMEKNSCKK